MDYNSNLIWDERFLVRVPYIDTCSDEYIKIFGTPSSGDAAVDKYTINELATICISINEMLDYHKRGVTIRVVQYTDIKLIYDIISAHLTRWANNLKHGLNIGGAPLEDLIDLDRFANVIYQHAKYHFTEETVGSILSQNMNRLGITKDTFFRSGSAGSLLTAKLNNPKMIIKKKDESGYPERTKLEDVFKGRVYGGRQ